MAYLKPVCCLSLIDVWYYENTLAYTIMQILHIIKQQTIIEFIPYIIITCQHFKALSTLKTFILQRALLTNFAMQNTRGLQGDMKYESILHVREAIN